jgi:hypothetical protein
MPEQTTVHTQSEEQQIVAELAAGAQTKADHDYIKELENEYKTTPEVTSEHPGAQDLGTTAVRHRASYSVGPSGNVVFNRPRPKGDHQIPDGPMGPYENGRRS